MHDIVPYMYKLLVWGCLEKVRSVELSGNFDVEGIN